MRYLKKRDIFLKSLNTGLIKYSEDDIKSINEVLQNDIAWGDSLLGRLINSIIRKAKIGINLIRMDSVIKSMYSLFDSLVSDSVISKMENPNKIKLIRYAMIMMVAELEKSAADKDDMILNSDVEMVENLSEIKKITDRIISGGEKDIDRIIEKSKNELTEKEISLLVEDKNKLISALKAFRESLNEIKDSESKDDKDLESNKESSVDVSIMIKNFTSLYKILFFYNEMITSKVKPETNNKQDIGEKDLKNTQKIENPVKDRQTVVESINEQISTELDRVLRPIHSYFKQYLSFPKNHIERKKEFYSLIGNESNKSSLLKIYSIVRKKSGINEGLVDMLTKPEAIADKIYKLYQVTKTKESGDFEGVDNLMKSEIATFNSTMREILNFKNTEKVYNDKTEDEKNTTSKTESKIYKYTEFIKEEVENKPDWYLKVNDIWRSVFLKKFDCLEKYNLTQKQIDELSKKAESISKNSKFINISGKDPIIEIVRLFNRAYKLHTVPVIPSGRSDGRVSNKTFREYQYVGSGYGGRPSGAGTVEPGMGPYRNIALFSKWENAVLDILSSSKYRVIFDKSTTIKIGDAEPKEGFGPKLKRFMNDMLYGDKQQYGANQHQFIIKYFDIGSEYIKRSELEIPNSGDLDYNAKVSAKVESADLEFKDVDDIDIKMGQIIRILYKDDKNNDRAIYGYVYSDKPGKYYMKLGRNTEFFRKYLPSNVKISDKLNQMSEDIFLVKLKDGKLKKGVDYTFSDSLNISKYIKDKTVEKKTIKIKPTKISILRDGNSDYIIDKPREFSKKDSSGKWIEIYNSVK